MVVTYTTGLSLKTLLYTSGWIEMHDLFIKAGNDKDPTLYEWVD